MSNFDPALFLDAVITEVQVKRPPLPAGQDFTATVGETKIRVNQGKADPTKSYTSADIDLVLDTAHIEGQPPTITLKFGILLDVTESGTIDVSPGKNGKLRQFREALGLNAPGTAFSFRATQGRTLKAKVGHRAYENELYDEVVAVAKA